MFKKSEKTIYFIIILGFILCLFVIFWANSDIPLSEIFNSQINIENLKSVLNNISCSLIASFVLIILVDKTIERYEKKDRAKRTYLINDKINRSCYKIYFLLAQLYKATRPDEIKDNDKVLHGLFNDIDGFYLQIKNSDLSKPSHANTVVNAITNNLNVDWVSNLLGKFDTLGKELTHIQVNFYDLMETDEIYRLNDFIDLVEKFRLCIFAFSKVYKLAPNVIRVENFISEDIFKNFMKHLEGFMKELRECQISSEYTSKNVTAFEIKKTFFESSDLPTKGSAVKE